MMNTLLGLMAVVVVFAGLAWGVRRVLRNDDSTHGGGLDGAAPGVENSDL